MSVWDSYPNLSPADFRTLVAVTAQVLLDADNGAPDLSSELLQQSTRATARELEPLLASTNRSINRSDIQKMLEDESTATDVCRTLLDQIRSVPALANRIAQEFDARKQKMTGIEVTLLAGALMILVIRIKRIAFGKNVIEFDPATKAVETVVSAVTKAL